jgi:hypothetical protein
MDGDSKREKNRSRDMDAYLSNGGDVLQPFWIRRFIRYGDEIDRFLLDYGLGFLLPFGTFLWFIFLIA